MKTQLKRHWLLLLATCFIALGVTYAQEIENPQVTPMSPESASLGRYGDMSLTNASGQMSYSVPIYTIDINGNQWPISLNYNYSGLILEGKPSLSGLGWQLSAYGNITKEVRGLPDGHPYGYYGDQGVKTHIDAVVADHLNGGIDQTAFYDLDKFSNGTWDSEVDKYTVNIAGDRFSFKLRLNANNEPEPYFLSRHNYKVIPEKDITQHFEMAAFTVIAPNGVEYYFNSDDRERVLEDAAGNTLFWDDKTTSWLLSEIKYPNGKTITFDYEPELFFSYDFHAYGFEEDFNASDPGPTLGGPLNWLTDYNDGIRISQIERQILKKITFPSGSIHLETEDVEVNFRKLYSKLKLKDHLGSVVNTYDFSYLGARDVLVSIQKNGEKFHDFEYFGVHTPGTIPSFIKTTPEEAHDQDFWRYFNNSGNSQAIAMPFSGGDIDKYPNINATKLGALRRIIYPTKGYTEVDYELNQYKVPYEENPGGNGLHANAPFNQSFELNLDARLDNNDRIVSITKTFDSPMIASIYHKIKGNVVSGNSIYLSINKISGTPDGTYSDNYAYPPGTANYYPHRIQAAREAMDPNSIYYPNPIISPYLLIAHEPGNNCAWYPGNGDDFSEAMGCVSDTEVDAVDSSRGRFWIVPGTYTFEIRVDHLTYDKLYGQLGMRWYDPSTGGETPEFINAYAGGLRVKHMTDYTDNGAKALKKVFNYNDAEDLSTGRLNQVPYFVDNHVWHENNGQNTHTRDDYLLNSFSALNINHGTPIYYSKITTTQQEVNTGPLWAPSTPNGQIIREYKLPYENVEDSYPRVPQYEDISKAMLKKETLTTDNGVTVSNSEKQFQYFRWLWEPGTQYDEHLEHPWSFKYFKKLVNNVVNSTSISCGSGPFTLGSECDLYFKGLHEIRLYKETDIISLVEEEVSFTQGVEQNKTYTYDTKLLLQEVKTNRSVLTGEYETKTEYDYPYELTSETQYDYMHSDNYIGIPVQTRVYTTGDELAATQKTNFYINTDAFGKRSYLPQNTWAAKGDNPLNKEIEYLYSNGNLVQFKRFGLDSEVTSFLWGYDHTVPIAKIDKVLYSTVLSTLNTDINTLQGLDGIALRNEMTLLRNNLSSALVTSYTYDPLVGVTSVTNPNADINFYTYDTQNRLAQVKDKDGHVLESYNYNNRIESLTAALNGPNSLYLSSQGNFSMVVGGGSGNYAYEWFVYNDVINLTQSGGNTMSVQTSTDYGPQFQVKCIATDLDTNLTIEKILYVNVTNTLAPLSVSAIAINPGGTSKAVGQTVNYSINVSGGSGNYQYSWQKSNGSQNINLGGSHSTSVNDTITTNDCNSFTISCVVTDAQANTTITKQVTINVTSGCPTGNQ